MYNEVIYLLSTKYTTNVVGDSIEVSETSMRLAKLKSIGQKEFYQAQANGLKPEIKFVLPDYLDYDNQEEVIHNGFRYKVLRTFKNEDNEIEITCHEGIRAEVYNVSS